jgi:hypothetical protein
VSGGMVWIHYWVANDLAPLVLTRQTGPFGGQLFRAF